jgi:signal transduction histidine kinase
LAVENSQLGLNIMKQRTKLLGGSLNVQSEPGKGTVLTVETGLV